MDITLGLDELNTILGNLADAWSIVRDEMFQEWASASEWIEIDSNSSALLYETSSGRWVVLNTGKEVEFCPIGKREARKRFELA